MLNDTLSFPCPSCKEIINDRMEQCRFCGAPVDKGIARMLAETQARVNQACSDASYMKTVAFVMWAFLGISLIPFVPLVYYGFVITFVILIVLIVRWQLRFSNINTSDPDYAKARRSKNIAFVLWLVALPVGFIFREVLFYLIFR